MGACQSMQAISLPEQPDECFICCHPATPSVKLECGHSIHMRCLASWWMQKPDLSMACPLCRHVSDDCFMELETTTQLPVGFYRNGFMYRLPAKPETDITCVKIKEEARDFAQAKAIELWMMMLMDREQIPKPTTQ